MAARRRTWVAAVGVAFVVGAIVAGCSSDSKDSATSTPSTSSSSTSTTAAAAGTTSPSSTSGTHSQPTLGRLAGPVVHGSGFGTVRPSSFSNGGDPTGDVGLVTWDSWGGARATGHGTSTYVAPDQATAQGTQERADIVAFDLGDCAGQYMYRKVQWYFPEHGQTFDVTAAEDICNSD
jgi:hypothetical protein